MLIRRIRSLAESRIYFPFRTNVNIDLEHRDKVGTSKPVGAAENSVIMLTRPDHVPANFISTIVN